MDKSIKLKNTELICILLTAFFVIINLLTLNWGIPWIDEVSYSDLSINFAEDGEYVTRAWFKELGGKAFPSYPPLHFLMLIPWVKIFGFSYFSCRCFGFFMLVLTFVVLYKLISNVVINNETVMIGFTLLFWGAADFMQYYRTARPDLVVFCMVSLFGYALYLWHLQKTKTTRRLLIIALVLVTLSGYQGTVYCFFYTMVYLVVFYSKKLLKSIIGLWIVSTIIAVVLLVVYFGLNNELASFIIRPFAFSDSIMSIFVKILPFLAENGIGDPSLLEKATDREAVDFSTQLYHCYFGSQAYIYSIPFFVILYVYRIFIAKTASRNDLILFVSVLLFPFYMTLIGRYPIYYAWIGYIHLLLAGCYMMRDVKNRYLIAIPFVVALFGVVYPFDYNKKQGYENIKTLVNRNEIKTSDIIVAGYPVYYDVRQKCKYTYMYGNYPLVEEEVMANLIFEWVDEVPKLAKGLADYKMFLKQSGYSYEPIDSISNPHIILYRIVLP